MSYSKGGLIQATDYNTMAQGGAAINHTVANINTVWGTGQGDKGYGQATTLATLPAGVVATATQWSTLIARLNSLAQHQTGAATGVSAPTAGNLLAYMSALQTGVNTVYANRGLVAIEGTDSAVTATTPTWVTATPTSFQIVRTFTFASGDAARYFFNAGGRLFLNFAAVNTGGNLKGANWVSYLNSKVASFSLSSKTNTVTGTGANNVVQTARGYWGLTATDTVLYSSTSGSALGAYDSNTVTIRARTNGVQGANGDNGTVITVTIDLNDLAVDTGLSSNISLQIGVNGIARRPETTALPTAIAYPTQA